MKQLKKLLAILLAALMLFSSSSVIVGAVQAETAPKLPAENAEADQPLTLNEALNVENGTIEFQNYGDYIDAEHGNYIWRIEDDHITSPETNYSSKKAIITAEITANEGDIVSFDFICTVFDASYVSGGLLFSIDNKSFESGRGYGYVGCNDWTHKEYALTAGNHTLKWVFQVSTGAMSANAKLDNVYVGEPVHPDQVVVQKTAEVGVNCRIPLSYEVLPETAFNKDVKFSSSDESIAIVLPDGYVVGIQPGVATITVAAVDGGVSDTCEVNVVESGIESTDLYAYSESYTRESDTLSISLNRFSSSLPEMTETVIELSPDETKNHHIAASAYAGGKIYGWMTKGYYEFRYVVIDEATQHIEYWGRSNVLNPTSMTYDYSNNTLYAIAYSDSGRTGYALYSVDIDNGELLKIADLTQHISAITASFDGKLYGFIYGTLFEINKTTGEMTRLFAYNPTDGYTKVIAGAFIDINTGILYAIFESRTSTTYGINYQLCRIDIENQTVEPRGYIDFSPRGFYAPNDIELPQRERTKYTVTFVDSMDGSVIGTKQYEVGTTLDENTFLTPPEHSGYQFQCWEYDENYDGEYLIYDITVTAYYCEEEAMVTILIDNYYDSTGSYSYWTTHGCQMLIDADADTYGTIIPEERVWGQTKIDDLDTFYDNFEYKLPEGASSEFSPYSSMYHKKQLINIPAGTYDWCFINPMEVKDGVDFLFMNDIGNIPACYDNYTFEAGFTYTFTVQHYISTNVTDHNSHVDLTIERGNTEPIYVERIEIVPRDIIVYGDNGAAFNVNVYPEDAFDKQIIYEASDASIAYTTNSTDPYVHGVLPGTTTITATSVDGHASAQLNVTVREAMPVVDFYGYVGEISQHAIGQIQPQAWHKYNGDEPMILSQQQVSQDYADESWNFPYNVCAAAYAGGKVYGYQDTLWYGNKRADFFVIDFDSNPENLVQVLSGVNAGLEVRDMAYNHANDTMYAIAVNEEYGDSLSLYKVDLSLGTLTEVAPLHGVDDDGCELYVLNFVIDADGNAYGLNEFSVESSSICKKNYLLNIDLATGEVTIAAEIHEANNPIPETNRYYLGLATAFDYENNQILYFYSGSIAQIIPGTGEVIYRQSYYPGFLTCMFITDDIPVSEPVKPSFTVTFIDDVDNSVIETRVVEGGTILDKATFPEVAEHDGVVFRGWDYRRQIIVSDLTIRAMYSSPEYITSVVKLTVEDGGFRVDFGTPNPENGYQMILDADANTSNEGTQYFYGWHTPMNDNGRQWLDEYYAEYEYSIPRYASGSEKNAETVLNETKSVRIPAGVYDWLILYDHGQCDRPFADSFGNIGGRFDDFEFLAGFVYEFKVYWKGEHHAIDLEITPIVPGENQDAGVCVVLGDIVGEPGEEVETEVIIEGEYEANTFDLELSYDASDMEVMEITPGEVIQEIVENGGEFELEQSLPGSGMGDGGSGNPDSSSGSINAKAESGGMAFSGNGPMLNLKLKIPDNAEAGEKNMDMTIKNFSRNTNDGSAEQIPHYSVMGNSNTGSIGGSGQGGSGGSSGGIGGGGGSGEITDPTIPTPPPSGEPTPTPEPDPNAKFMVTFVDWDGRTIAIRTVQYGESAAPPDDPARENFIFIGWEGDYQCVTANTRVTAVYGPIPQSGDISGDGALTSTDALMAMRHVLGTLSQQLTPAQLEAADFNGDGRLNSTDALLVMRRVLGLLQAD